jgi:hypothetical protein
MSRENTEVARIRVGPDAHLPKRRTLDERLIVRWPWLYSALARAGNRLPSRSRLRRAGVRRAVLSGWAAWARQDLDLMLVRYAPDCRLDALPEMVAAGMPGTYHGHAGVRELAADWREVWERMEPIPQEIVDAGARVVVLGHSPLRARASGIEFDRPIALVFFNNERGLVAHQRDFNDWDEALRAAGLRE